LVGSNLDETSITKFAIGNKGKVKKGKKVGAAPLTFRLKQKKRKKGTVSWHFLAVSPILGKIFAEIWRNRHYKIKEKQDIIYASSPDLLFYQVE